MSRFVIPKTVHVYSLVCKEYCTTLPLQIVPGETCMTHNILCSLGYTFETPKNVSALIFKHWNDTYQNISKRKTDMLLKQRYKEISFIFYKLEF